MRRSRFRTAPHRSFDINTTESEPSIQRNKSRLSFRRDVCGHKNRLIFKEMNESGKLRRFAAAFLFAALAHNPAWAQSPGELADGYLRDLIRLNSTNPPGNETRVANYLKQLMDREGIPAELVGED